MTASPTLLHRHRRAGHQRPRRDGPLGLVRDAALRDRGRPRRLGRPGRARRRPPTRPYDVGGRAVIPGFVDSHSPPGLRRRPGAEFAARMTGERLRRRRHPHHRRGHPRRHRRAAHRQRRPARRRDAAPGHHHGRDQERLRADRPRRGAQPRGRPRSSPRRPRSSAPTSSREGTHAPRTYVDLVTGPMLDAGRAVRPVDRRVLRARRLRRRPGARGPRGRCGARACAGGCTPTSSGRGRACSWPASSAWSRSTTAPTSPTPTSTALRDSGTVATLLPGVEFSTRSPYPDARRLLDAGVQRRARQRLQPGLVLHLVDAAVHRAGRPRDGDDPGRGAVGRDRSAVRRALDRDDVGRARAPAPRADLVVLEAPSYLHLAYRPGVPLARETFLRGRQLVGAG